MHHMHKQSVYSLIIFNHSVKEQPSSAAERMFIHPLNHNARAELFKMGLEGPETPQGIVSTYLTI